MPEVTLENVRKTFGDNVAVADSTLVVDDSEMVTLLGPSGCGKSTTLRMLAGLEEPDSGKIRFGERVIVDSSRGLVVPTQRRNLGMVFQSYAIWPHMTVAENVAYPLRRRRVGKSELDSRVQSMLDLVGLSRYKDQSATKLSGGEQQRVALARALVFEPDLLLLDEPLSNLDAKLRDHMRFEIQAMQNRLRLTTIYVTHDQQEALTLSDRIAVMNNGHIEQYGTPSEVYDNPATPFVADFIGQTNFLPVDSINEIDHANMATVGASTASGHEVVRGRLAEGSSLTVGDPATMGVRPERLKVEKTSPDAEANDPSGPAATNRLKARVTAEAFLGDQWEYVLALNDDVEWRVKTPPDHRLEVGAMVAVEFDAASTFIY